MLVRFSTDAMGNLYGDPVSDRQRRALVSRIPGHCYERDALYFVQECDVAEELCNIISPRAIRNLIDGRPTVARVHCDNFSSMVGAE